MLNKAQSFLFICGCAFHVPESILHDTVLAGPPTGACVVTLKDERRLLTAEFRQKAAALNETKYSYTDLDIFNGVEIALELNGTGTRILHRSCFAPHTRTLTRLINSCLYDGVN